MGVYIKGMEMPKDRPQLLWVYPNGKALTVQSDVDPWKELQAVPVPPHGRCIDADAAKEILKPIDSLCCYEPEWTWGELYESNCVAIDKLPTIISAEEGET